MSNILDRINKEALITAEKIRNEQIGISRQYFNLWQYDEAARNFNKYKR